MSALDVDVYLVGVGHSHVAKKELLHPELLL
jgi:hypothetical protein